jgi:hypothetical protein
MREWVEGGCRQGTEVEVVSTIRHVRGDTKDRSEWMTTVTSNAPGHIESEGVRKGIETKGHSAGGMACAASLGRLALMQGR